MDKFLIRKTEVITEPECTAMASTSITSFVEQDKPSAKKQKLLLDACFIGTLHQRPLLQRF
jgi:hypothetical protein